MRELVPPSSLSLSRWNTGPELEAPQKIPVPAYVRSWIRRMQGPSSCRARSHVSAHLDFSSPVLLIHLAYPRRLCENFGNQRFYLNGREEQLVYQRGRAAIAGFELAKLVEQPRVV
ncbi:hypothetical protein EJ110_NYTH52926 [Nymphaea thermarum]|nr:hypothetical protein EJ110_NYTH52926 [Nymphaea thermarum]